MKESLKMVMPNAPRGGGRVTGSGRVGNRSLGTVNVNWARKEMTTSWATAKNRALVCVCGNVYGGEIEGESVNERMRERERERRNVGKQSFNGAENNKNGKREGGEG